MGRVGRSPRRRAQSSLSTHHAKTLLNQEAHPPQNPNLPEKFPTALPVKQACYRGILCFGLFAFFLKDDFSGIRYLGFCCWFFICTQSLAAAVALMPLERALHGARPRGGPLQSAHSLASPHLVQGASGVTVQGPALSDPQNGTEQLGKATAEWPATSGPSLFSSVSWSSSVCQGSVARCGCSCLLLT